MICTKFRVSVLFFDQFYPHLKFSYPFDYETTPGYELIYVLNVVYNIYLATYFAACDIFFVSCGLHLVGATQEIENFLSELDKEIDDIIDKNEMRYENCPQLKMYYNFS